MHSSVVFVTVTIYTLCSFIIANVNGNVEIFGCPQRCTCQQRIVRCLRQQLDKIPDVPADTNIIDLRYNRIREIPAKAFYGLSHLHTIFLNENQLATIHSGAFEGLPSLKYLFLNKNHISKISSNAFNHLERLESIYLQNNNISELHPETFANLRKLERLFLYDNDFIRIPSGSFENMPSLKRLRLDSNDLDCDCSMLWFIKMLKHRKSTLAASATCKTPQNFADRNLYDISEGDFQCKKPEITENPNDVQVNTGGTAIFICRAAGDPKPEIIWMFNTTTQLHSDDSKITVLPDGTLRIDHTNSSDVGQYFCMAKNDMGEIHSRSARMILQPAIIAQEDVKRPKFNVTPSNMEVGALQTIILHCTATGNPQPQIHWSINDEEITQNTNRLTVHVNGTLIIQQALLEDSGTYKCEASNYLGSITTSANVRINATLVSATPKASPTFTVQPTGHTLRKIGSSVILECEAIGQPSPKIWWKRAGGEDHPMLATNRITFSEENTKIHIEHAKESDSGQYICVAENSEGRVEAISELKVVEQFGPPKFLFEPYDLEALPGTTIELPCKEENDVPVQIKWKKDGATLTQTTKYRISTAGSLYIANITELDAGRYECSLFNENGRATAAGLVTVRRNEELAAGDRFVKIAFAEATREVNAAINQTVAELFSTDNNTVKAKHHGDLFRIVRFPTGPARELARAAEIYERTLVNIRKHVESGLHLSANKTDFNYTDLLSPDYVDLLAQLSGCMGHRPTPNCTEMCYHSKYRTIDGTCNNFDNPTWGASLTGFRRILPPIYENELSMPIGWMKSKLYNGYSKPSARLISTSMIKTEEITPDEIITHMVMQWGQFLDHDLDHAIPSVSSESWDGVDCKKTCDYAAPCYPIEIPDNDPRVGNRRCIDFVRSSAICGSGMTSVFFGTIQPREQINQLTSYIDGSQIYGYNEQFARDLRNLTSDTGHMREGLTFPGQKPMLPFAAPTDGIDCRRDLSESTVNCFTAGDIRANEQVGLLAMHTIWFREHNRIATELGEINPHWSGDTIYQETRKIVGAQLQHITYTKWLPQIIGADGMELLGKYDGYKDNVDASIANVFATAVLRFGHTLINPVLHRLDENFDEIPQGHLPLHKAFFAPWRVVYEGGVDPLLRGLFTVPAKLKMPGQNLNTELTEKLFQTAHAVALDLAAINIQRSRDHAIPGYNEYRRVCNMTVAETFDDLKEEISNNQIRDHLKELYGHPSNIDIWVGGILEDQSKGARVGPLFRCLLVEQFKRLRDGDRFWYENPNIFKPEQLEQIKRSSLASVLCNSADNITKVTDDVFVLPKLQGYKKCSNIKNMNLRFWSDCGECSKKHSASLQRQRRSRNRRDLIPSNETKIHYDTEMNFIDEDMNEERVEGLENLIEHFQKNLKQMRRKIRKLEQTCSANTVNSNNKNTNNNNNNNNVKNDNNKTSKPHAHCLDDKGIKRLNNEIWMRDDCTKCECEHHQISCVTELCPQIKCDNSNNMILTKLPNKCCAECVSASKVGTTPITPSMPLPPSSEEQPQQQQLQQPN